MHVLSTLMIALLCIQSTRVSRRLSQLGALVHKPPPGFQLPPLLGQDLDGRKVRKDLAATSGKTLLLGLSARCPYCEEIWPQWQTLMNSGEWTPMLVDVADSVDAQYIHSHSAVGLDFVKATPDTIFLYRMSRTPTTVLVGDDGAVLHSVVGVLKPEDVEAFLSAAD